MKFSLKKTISVYLAAIIPITVIIFPQTVFADTESTISSVISEDFEGEQPMEFYVNGSANGVYEKPSETYYTGKAYKASTNNVLLSSVFAPVYLFNDYEGYGESNNPHNLYTETEFDVMPVSYSGNAMIRFSSDVNTDNTSAGAISFNAESKKIQLLCREEKRKGSAAYTELGDYKLNQSYRIKVIFHITDLTDTTCEEISAVFIDGESVLLKPMYFASHSIGKIPYYNALRIQNGTNIYLDNICIKSYTSDYGTSPVTERGALIKSLRDAFAFIYENENAENKNNYSDEDITQMKEFFEAAEDVYNNENEQSIVDAAMEEIKKIYEIPKNGGDDPAPIPDKVKYTVNQDFESKETSPFKTGVITETDEPTTLNVLKIDGAAQGISVVSDKFTGAGVITEDCDCYTDFDIKFGALVSKGTSLNVKMYKDSTPDGTCILQLVFDGINKKIQLIHSVNQREDITENDFLKDDMWYGIRIVLHTSSAPNSRRPTVSVYINGECIADKMYTQSYSDKASEYNTISFVGMTGQDTSINIDNFKVCKVSEGETAIPRDIAKMNNVMRLTYSLLKNAVIGFNEGEYSEEDYNFVKNEYDTALEKYKKISNQSDIDDIYTMLSNALSNVKPNKKSIFVNIPTADKTDLSGDSVKITVKLTTGKSLRTDKNINIICSLMENSDEFSCGLCRDVQMKTVLLKTNSETDVIFNVPLSEYQNRENMYVSIAAVDDFENLNGITERPYYLFGVPTEYKLEENELSDSVVTSYKYINGIAVSEIAAKTDKDKQVNIVLLDSKKKPAYFLQIMSDNTKTAVLRVISDGMEQYEYAVKAISGEVRNGVIYHADVQNINRMFGELYSSKEKLKDYGGYIGIDIDTYDSAYSLGTDVSSVFDEIISTKKYNASDAAEFARIYNKNISALTDIRNAENIDTVLKNISNIGEQLTKYTNFKNANNTKKYGIAEYVYHNRSYVKNNSSLDIIIAKAITTLSSAGNPSEENTGGGGSVKTSGGSASGTYSRGNVIVSAAENDSREEATHFVDMLPEHWAYTAVNTFKLLKLIDGTSDTEFSPDDNIKREDFIKICISAFGLYDENSRASFTDINESDYFYKYVASAIEKGLIQGQTNDTFGTGALLTRQDMAVIVYRLCKNIETDINNEGVYIPFSDEAIFADYAKEAIIYLARNGIINGRENNLYSPMDYCTRAEAVKMMYELYGRRC